MTNPDADMELRLWTQERIAVIAANIVSGRNTSWQEAVNIATQIWDKAGQAAKERVP